MQPITKTDFTHLKELRVEIETVPMHPIPPMAARPPEPAPALPAPVEELADPTPVVVRPLPVYHLPAPLPGLYRALLPLCGCAGALCYMRLVYVQNPGLSALGAAVTAIEKCYRSVLLQPATIFAESVDRVGAWSGSLTPFIHVNPALTYIGMGLYVAVCLVALGYATGLALRVLFRLCCRIAKIARPLDTAWPRFARANILGLLVAPLTAGGLVLIAVALGRLWMWLFARA